MGSPASSDLLTPSARPLQLRAGPLGVSLSLDEGLAALAPAAWSGSGAGALAEDRIVLRTRRDPKPTPPAAQHGFRDGTLSASLSFLRRTQEEGGARIEGETAAELPALTRAVRFATQPSLLALGWLPLHASSVLLPDGVHVMVARSGTGKSTLARRLVAHGGELVGDEVALVGGEAEAAAHPGQLVHGALGRQHRIAAIHLLSQGISHTEPVAPGRAAAELLSAAMVYVDGAEAVRESLALVGRLVAQVPVLHAQVPNDDSALALFPALFARSR